MGISNFWFSFLMDGVFGNISGSFFFIPLMSYFAQVVPEKIEGTIFALMTGVTNLSFSVVSPLIGNYINDSLLTYRLNKSDMTGMW